MPGPAHAVHGQDRITKNVYDPVGRLAEIWDGVGSPLQRREAAYTFSSMGRKTSLTDARGYRAEMKYDAFDRQSRWVFPSKTTPGAADQGDYEEYLYDADGNRTSLRKRDARSSPSTTTLSTGCSGPRLSGSRCRPGPGGIAHSSHHVAGFGAAW